MVVEKIVGYLRHPASARKNTRIASDSGDIRLSVSRSYLATTAPFHYRSDAEHSARSGVLQV
jgi:hypothetical protein